MQCGSSETKMYYLYCEDQKFTSIRENHINLLKKRLAAINPNSGIISSFCMILRHKYKDWWMNEILTDTIGTTLLQAMHNQQKLRIHGLPLGQLSILWKEAQAVWIKATNTSSYRGDWRKDVIITLHTYTYSIWKERNNILHQDSKKSTRVLAKQ